jgi:hypothetical protein
MNQLLLNGPESLSLLYGDVFYIFPQDALAAAPGPEVAKPILVSQPIAEAVIPSALAPKTKLEPVIEPAGKKPGITWRPKPMSKVLFVLQLAEFKDPALTDFLKKIVDSLGIAPEFVGFGQIDGMVHLEEFDLMPNPFAVVFDSGVWGGADNPVKLGKGEVYFTQCLQVLQDDQDVKRQLWAHLKVLKEKIQ